MAKKNLVIVLLVGLVLAMSSLACGGAEPPTVDAVVEHQTEAVEEGVACEYILISTDVQVRLAHYRICKDDNNEKRLKALEKALNDCFELCDASFPDIEGGKSTDNVACIAQCKGE